MTPLVALHGTQVSLVVEPQTGGAPIWRHWGARLAVDGAPVPYLDSRTAASFSLDQDVPLTTAPGAAPGWFGPPVVQLHGAGVRAQLSFASCRVEQVPYGMVLHLRDEDNAIALIQRFVLDPASDVLTVATRLENRGESAIGVDWLASGLFPLPTDCDRILSFTGRHNAEFAESVEQMPHHSWIRDNRRGLTGHAGPPGLFILREGAGRHSGDVYACQLAWSGNHRLSVDRDDEGFWTVQAGALLAPGELTLGPGESFEAPELLATFSRAGLNGASQNFHAAIRARLGWPGGQMTPRRVHLNSWEGFYFDHDTHRAMALAERAAALGVERFVLDDGWFKGRDHDRAGLGDWTPDPQKYPEGLAALARHVTGLGMEFGLWVEPEMVNPDSDLYRAHPDWALGVAGQPLVTARNQLVLDMAREDVRDHLFAQIDALLQALPIGYLKWDHNRDLAPAVANTGRATAHHQVLGTYQLLDRIRAAHPEVEIESCAGGGGRIDAGIALRTHRFWTSDNLDAVSRVAIQRGFLAFMPPELMGAHVGASPAHATGRSQSLGFRAGVAMAGHFGVELDPGRLDAASCAALAEWIGKYKSHRDRLHSGKTWLGEGADGLVWQAQGEVGDLMLFITRTAPARDRRPQPIRLPMLSGAGPQTVVLETIAGAHRSAGRLPPLHAAMRDGGIGIGGDWLAESGLPLPPMSAETVAMFRITGPS